ncbi:hypothetical protein LY28_00010 [Ruminiclostridium sufflavum DSM 19573]|uniref:Uncharacterized protein n=1 Tax=Ruminiclostridium sufflavum DSM 19573 TaxID=1121337 RepID=A0A318XU17_9FIRM|nr:hypothetical protein [Ruminiclostridium sufflavum]PYG90130.1 hypothetical protein LY28_00010 [Ruminiclostridium sufflavum DSM 19573]
MMAVVCKNGDNEIFSIVEDVKRVSDNEIIGQNTQLAGINLEVATFKVLNYDAVYVDNKIGFTKNEEKFFVGDIFDISQETDKRDLLGKSETQSLQQQMSDLNIAIAALIGGAI